MPAGYIWATPEDNTSEYGYPLLALCKSATGTNQSTQTLQVSETWIEAGVVVPRCSPFVEQKPFEYWRMCTHAFYTMSIVLRICLQADQRGFLYADQRGFLYVSTHAHKTPRALWCIQKTVCTHMPERGQCCPRSSMRARWSRGLALEPRRLRRGVQERLEGRHAAAPVDQPQALPTRLHAVQGREEGQRRALVHGHTPCRERSTKAQSLAPGG